MVLNPKGEGESARERERLTGTSDEIDKLQEGLYSRGSPEIGVRNYQPLTPHRQNVSSNWAEDDTLTNELKEGYVEQKKSSIFAKIFIASILFFVIAAGIAAYILLGGFNAISSKNVDIAVEGPVALGAGEDLVLDVTVLNNNNIALEQIELFVEYPPGTRVSGDITKELNRDSIPLDNISAGDSSKKTIKAVLFGEKDSVKQIKMTVDYKAHGSNASFSKEKTYDIVIKSSPIIMEVTYPKEINSGQDTVFTVNIVSNLATVIHDLLFRVEYPFGFSFTDSTPKATADNNIWRIGDLSPNEKRTITIKGKIEGQNEEERTFRFNTGVAKINDENQIGVNFISLAETISIKKPFIALRVFLNRSEDKEYSTKIGDHIKGEVSWVNNLPITINDAQVQVKFSGNVLDRSSVKVGRGGFYRSLDNTITWDKNNVPELNNIGPGDTSSVSFDFNSMPSSQTLIAAGRNLEMLVDVLVKGTRIAEGDVPQMISSVFSRKVKIETNLGLNSRVLYSIGPFKNTCPIPPKADKNTTYTVVWTLSNTFNDVSTASVSATLPSYVKWLGNVSPTTASTEMIYSESNRTIVWNASEIKAGSGFTSAAKEISFQISLEPSLSQVNSAPILVDNIGFGGTDRFTLKTISETKSPLTTKTSTDPAYNGGNETVVK